MLITNCEVLQNHYSVVQRWFLNFLMKSVRTSVLILVSRRRGIVKNKNKKTPLNDQVMNENDYDKNKQNRKTEQQQQQQ